jgi:hypothetical protein
VTGARHLKVGRNGQDAAVARITRRGALAVVCDGCSSGAYSEVGARLGALIVAQAIERVIDGNESVAGGAPVGDAEVDAVALGGAVLGDVATWRSVRAEVVAGLAAVAELVGGDRERVVHDQLLFTIVAAAVRGEEAVVWAVGDGAYALTDAMSVIGPFEGNAPPYLAYELTRTGEVMFDVTGGTAPNPRADGEVLVVVPPGVSTIAVATDGVCDLEGGLVPLTARRFVDHPDALRRHLAVLARPRERIDWDAQRVVREPAVLQDDCAVAIIRRRAP